MSVFQMYIELGFKHIIDINGFDHILFLLCLVAIYHVRQWLKVLKLLTAFTIGHSISLALATLNYIQFSTDIIEFIIPVTIVITAIINLSKIQKSSNYFYQIDYLLACIFGIVHGLGFSVLLKSLLESESSLISSLFAFNLGLEIGQIIIVSLILCIGFLFQKYLKVNQRTWGYFLSILGLISSLYLSFERWPF